MRTSCDEILRTLIHDLRQPLGNVETGIFYLELVLDSPSDRVREQMQMMERQVAQAAQLLHRASEELREQRTQRTIDGGTGVPESLPFTKSATAAVT
jgi:signal transduction histidine kinase